MRAAIARAPDDIELGLQCAADLELAGEAQAAEELLAELYRQAPEHPDVLNSYGYLLVERNKELDRAERLIAGALAQEPENPAFLDSMGWLCYKRGDLRTAAEWLRRAIERGGRHPEIYEHLARVQIDQGDRGEAARTLRRGLAVAPESSILLEMIELLDQGD
jgi:Flp pilus assembly protein TadD